MGLIPDQGSKIPTCQGATELIHHGERSHRPPLRLNAAKQINVKKIIIIKNHMRIFYVLTTDIFWS